MYSGYDSLVFAIRHTGRHIKLNKFHPHLAMNNDSNTSFLLEQHHVRGQIVQLNEAWQALQSRQTYDSQLAQVLGETLAAVSALASTVKLNGALILQIQGDGPVSTLVAQATNEGLVRGLARNRSALPDKANLTEMVGDAKLVITIEGEGAQRYQGIVNCEGDTISEALDGYFKQSEQLATRVWLAANEHSAACLLLQQLPSQKEDKQRGTDSWQHLCTLSNTITQAELLDLEPEQILHRLFHEERVKIFEPSPLAFQCQCSRQKVADMIANMGEQEAMQLIAEQGQFKADCEFCGKSYVFDPVDIVGLFADAQAAPEASQ